MRRQTYYPGDDVTDLLGLSLYSFAANARTRNDALTGTEFSSTFESFYDLYSYRGPRLVISETGKPYNCTSSSLPFDRS